MKGAGCLEGEEGMWGEWESMGGRDVLALFLEPPELLVGARERTLVLRVRLDMP